MTVKGSLQYHKQTVQAVETSLKSAFPQGVFEDVCVCKNIITFTIV